MRLNAYATVVETENRLLDRMRQAAPHLSPHIHYQLALMLLSEPGMTVRRELVLRMTDDNAGCEPWLQREWAALAAVISAWCP